MPSIPTISPSNVKGLVGKVVGLYEEVVGSLLNNERLTKRGQLHQEAATNRLSALRHTAEAAKEKTKAAGAKTAQVNAQQSKEQSA